MALPPNIPTSFVPHARSSTSHQSFSYLTNAFGTLAYIIFCIVFALAIGVFLYGRVLSSTRTSEDTKLAAAEKAIDPTAAENFVRLRDRLSSGETLLNNHVAFSSFFTAFENIVPTNVRFTSLHLSIGDKGAVNVTGSGAAKTFNALAVASETFARNDNIKNAIFSNIAANAKDGSVSFSFTASLDPKLIAFSPGTSSVVSNVSPITTSTSTISTASTSPKQATTSPKTKL